MSDHLIIALLHDRPVRVVAAMTTEVAREAVRRHGVVAGGQVALARAATCGLLISTLNKGRERLTLQIRGNGPLGGVIVDANGDGDVRAYLENPGVLVAGGPDRRVRLGRAVGRRGVVSVVRDLGMRERVSGQAPILSGEIDADVEHYLTTSEQVESAMGSDAVLAADGTVRAAGGVLVQCLPDDPNREMVSEMWRRLRLDAVYDTLAESNDSRPLGAESLARAVLGEFGDSLSVLDQREVRFRCACTRERVLRMLALLSEAELESMAKEDGGAEVTCDFCREIYAVDAGELDQIKKNRTPVARG